MDKKLDKEEYLSKVERKLRRNYLIATWDQAKRNVALNDVNFDLIVMGDTGKISVGFLARLFASAFLPRRKVAAMVTVTEEDRPISVEGLVKIVNAAKEYMAAEKLHWIWLVTAAYADFLANTLRFAEEYYEGNIAILLVNLEKREVSAFTQTGLGRTASSLLKP